MKRLALHIAVILILALIIANAKNAIIYATEAMSMCIYMIIPTLFPFFVCSGILIYSGFCEKLAHLFRFCMKPLFRVGESGASAFVLGIISGYPLGAVTAGELYQNGYLTKTESERLLAFCNNSGPLFILGSVGAAMYANIKFGIILYVIHILSAITVGVLFRFYKKNDYTAPKTYMTSPQRSVGEIFSVSLQNAISTMLTVCGAVVFFSIASRLILDVLPVYGTFKSVLTGLCEFVTGSTMVSGLDINAAQKLVLSAFIIGFAGLSVHVQVMAVTAKYGLSLVPYIFGKLLHGVVAALYTMLYLHFFPITLSVFRASVSKGFAASSAYETAAVLCVALMSALLIILSRKRI